MDSKGRIALTATNSTSAKYKQSVHTARLTYLISTELHR